MNLAPAPVPVADLAAERRGGVWRAVVRVSQDDGMTLLLDDLRDRQRRAVGGPPEWGQAWDRVLELTSAPWQGREMIWDSPVLADGAATLALALYLIATDTGTAPATVTRAQVEALLAVPPDGTVLDVTARWDALVSAAGHDPRNPGDPVSICWQGLQTDHSLPADAPDWMVMDGPRRWGIAYQEGLGYALMPRFGLDF
ncbi:hypothetical protein [Kitasatospora sp. NPDC059327]|uniref:hypothetical protein n=1 Tax=Kitasatospora sp. NPDC059327 TaxID=3346803 RepID=UPI003676FCCA